MLVQDLSRRRALKREAAIEESINTSTKVLSE
jgi:hypothetical protein